MQSEANSPHPAKPARLPHQRQAAAKPSLKGIITLFSGPSARQGYLAAIDQAVISLGNFLGTLILARQVSPAELGIYGVGFTALRLVRAVQEGLTIQPLNTIGAAQDESAFRSYAASTSLIQLGLALLSSAAVAGMGWALTRMGNDMAGPAIQSLWFAFLFWQLQEYLRRMLYTRGKVWAAVLNTCLANLVRLVLLIYWLGQGRQTGITGLDAIAWGSLAALLPGLWHTRRYWTIHFDPLLPTLQRNWRFGSWIMGGTLANWLSVEAYPVLTAGLISFAAAGAYRALQNLVAPIHLLLRAIDTFMTPRAARAYAAQGQAGVTRILRLTYLVAGVPILGLLGLAIAFPAPILHALYGQTYLEYSGAMVGMAVFYGLWFAYWPLQTTFKAMGASRPIFLANLIAVAAMFTFGLAMIYRWGVYGTIAGQALNAAIIAIFYWITWKRLKQ